MSLEAQMYRKFANDCIARAQIADDPDTAAGLIRLAQYWLSKAGDLQLYPVPNRSLSPLAGSKWLTRRSSRAIQEFPAAAYASNDEEAWQTSRTLQPL